MVRGFTVVELILSIAIVGILVAVSVSEFTKMQYRAKRSEASVNIGGISTAQIAMLAASDTLVTGASNPGTSSLSCRGAQGRGEGSREGRHAEDKRSSDPWRLRDDALGTEGSVLSGVQGWDARTVPEHRGGGNRRRCLPGALSCGEVQQAVLPCRLCHEQVVRERA